MGEQSRYPMAGAIATLVLLAVMPAPAEVETTPAAMIRRHGIPSESPTPLPPTPTPTFIPCDCDGNRVVSIAELVRAVNLALSGESADACGGLDNDRDGTLTVGELIVGVRHALYGCAVLAVPDGVFDCNVFIGSADPFTPAIVRQDIDGTLHLRIDFDIARSLQATGRVSADGTLRLEGTSRVRDHSKRITGIGELRVADDLYFLQAALSHEGDDEPRGVHLGRAMHGTPRTWNALYDVTLSGEAGSTTLPLTIEVPPNGFADCDGGAADGEAPRLRSGPCLVSEYGGFRFTTALQPAAPATEIVLFGLLVESVGTVTGSGIWGAVASGETLGNWTAVRRTD